MAPLATATFQLPSYINGQQGKNLSSKRVTVRDHSLVQTSLKKYNFLAEVVEQAAPSVVRIEKFEVT